MERAMLPLPSAEHAAAPASGESPYPSRVPLLSAALAQCGALLVIGLVLTQVPEAAIGPGGGMPWAALQGGLAALLGRVLGMDRWWMSIHLLFAPGLLWAIGLGLPSQYPLIAFCLLASVYWGVSRTRVPLFLSSRAAAREILNLLPRERNFRFGRGAQRSCARASTRRLPWHRSGAHAVFVQPVAYGIEHAQLPRELGGFSGL